MSKSFSSLLLIIFVSIFAFDLVIGNNSKYNPGTRKMQSLFLNVLKGQSINLQQRSRSNVHISKNLVNLVEAKIGKDDFYSSMNPDHRAAVQLVMNAIKGNGRNGVALLTSALAVRDLVNLKVWYRALTNLIYVLPNFQSFSKPSPIEVMTDTFFSMTKLMRSSRVDQESCLLIDESEGFVNGIENRVWYFREDIFLNAHHWFFHVAQLTDFDKVNEHRPDRRGELFGYMHHNLMARYNAERWANGLDSVTPFFPLKGDRIPEGYVTNFMDGFTGRRWTDREPDVIIEDIFRDETKHFYLQWNVSTQDLKISRDRIYNSIGDGYFLCSNGTHLPNTHWSAIDILGDVLQAVASSVNPEFYGFGKAGLHNNGHLLIANIMDPHDKTKKPPGVMEDEATALRDPIFWRWHTFVDDTFALFQNKQKPYKDESGEFQLLWKGVSLSNVKVQSQGLKENELRTFFTLKKIKLRKGLDLANLMRNDTNGSIDVCAKHLDHQVFTYHFTINQENSINPINATVRVFLAPRFDKTGKTLTIEQQRYLFFVMDTFQIILNPGINMIVRNSMELDSDLYIPTAKVLMGLDADETNQLDGYCGCGFPHHLLLPKGTEEGMPFDLFVMVTNGDEDAVDENADASDVNCNSAYIFCGVPERKYPDARPMGYPFDRPIQNKDQNLEEWVSGFSNMKSVQIKITHSGFIDVIGCCASPTI